MQLCSLLFQYFFVVSLNITLLNKLVIMNLIFSAQSMESSDTQLCISNCTHFNAEYYNSWPVVIMQFTKGQKKAKWLSWEVESYSR